MLLYYVVRAIMLTTLQLSKGMQTILTKRVNVVPLSLQLCILNKVVYFLFFVSTFPSLKGISKFPILHILYFFGVHFGEFFSSWCSLLQFRVQFIQILDFVFKVVGHWNVLELIAKYGD